ncbi:MAG TPA: hypothetical protein VIV06_09630, partial [Candidatus Limnocylindrales bacterium]
TNVFGNGPRIAHKYEVLRRHCEEVGRPFDDIERTTLQSVRLGGAAPEAASRIVDRFGELADAGAQHVIFSVAGVADVANFELLGKDVFPQLRDLS